MRILLVNVPHPSIGSRIPDDHLPPLGLLAIGGPLLDAGHEVRLLDADLEAGRGPLWKNWGPGHYGNTSLAKIVADAVSFRPDAILFGHSGSSSAHPVVAEVSRAVAAALPDAWIVYGGVFPSYHWEEIFENEPQIDVIVRGEGEETCLRLIEALEAGKSLGGVRGIAYRTRGGACATPPADVIRDLDAWRVGWELIDFERYSYWGGKRAVVVQFSRGCPHLCSYCGQRGFWTKWRHRDPVLFARELARLHREHGVEVFNFADENPTVDRNAWIVFLETLIEERLPLVLVGSTRAGDIVRDADILHLYKKAGWVRFLLGMENTDEATLSLIKKGSTTAVDREAIVLLRKHGILSMATWAVGFEEETDRDFLHGLRQLLAYDPDQIQLLFVTPHRWTPYYRVAADRRILVNDRRKWDYKHQVLETRHVPAWRVLLWTKATEAILQARPRAVARTFFSRDEHIREAMQWYAEMGRRVWVNEIVGFFLRDERLEDGPTVREQWGEPDDAREKSMTVALRRILPRHAETSVHSAAQPEVKRDGIPTARQHRSQGPRAVPRSNDLR